MMYPISNGTIINADKQFAADCNINKKLSPELAITETFIPRTGITINCEIAQTSNLICLKLYLT